MKQVVKNILKRQFVEKSIVSCFFYTFLGIIYLTTVEAVAVESGQYFWQIDKPGLSSPGYIMGSIHTQCLDDNSLPLEIKTVLRNSTLGLIELSSEEHKIKSQNKYLPEGLTLSDYLGREKTSEIFDFIHIFLTTYNNEDNDLEKYFEQSGIPTTYSDFNPFGFNSPQLAANRMRR